MSTTLLLALLVWMVVIATIAIELYIHRYNTFGPLHLVDEHESWHGPGAWRSEGANWSYEYVLRRTGILTAPVVLTES